MSIHSKLTTTDDSGNVTAAFEDDTDNLTTTGIDTQTGGDTINTSGLKVALGVDGGSSGDQSYTDNGNQTDNISDSFNETIVTSLTVNINLATGDSSTEVDHDHYTRWGSDTVSDTAQSTSTPSGDGESEADSGTSNDVSVFDFHDEADGSFNATASTVASGLTTVDTLGNTYNTTSDGQDTQTGDDAPVMTPMLVSSDGSGGSAAQTFSDTIHSGDEEADSYSSTIGISETITTDDGLGNTTTATDVDNNTAWGTESSSDNSTTSETPGSDGASENAGGSDTSGGYSSESFHDVNSSTFNSTMQSVDGTGTTTTTIVRNTDNSTSDGMDTATGSDTNSVTPFNIPLVNASSSDPVPFTDNSGGNDQATDDFSETIVASTDVQMTYADGDSSHQYDEDDSTRWGSDSASDTSSSNDTPDGNGGESEGGSGTSSGISSFSFHDEAHGSFDSTMSPQAGTVSTTHNWYASTSDGNETQTGSDAPTVPNVNVPLTGGAGTPVQVSDTIGSGDQSTDSFTSTNSFSLTVTTDDGAGNTTTTSTTDTISRTGTDSESASDTTSLSPGNTSDAESVGDGSGGSDFTTFNYTEIVTQNYDATQQAGDVTTLTHTTSRLSDSGTESVSGSDTFNMPSVQLTIPTDGSTPTTPPVQFTDTPGGDDQTTDSFSSEYHSSITVTDNNSNGDYSTQATHENYTATGTDSESVTSNQAYVPDSDGTDDDESDTETDNSTQTYWFLDERDGTVNSLVTSTDGLGNVISTQTNGWFTTTSTGLESVSDNFALSRISLALAAGLRLVGG